MIACSLDVTRYKFLLRQLVFVFLHQEMFFHVAPVGLHLFDGNRNFFVFCCHIAMFRTDDINGSCNVLYFI